MDILLWIGWACAVAALFFVTLIGFFGAIAMNSPRWNHEFHTLGRKEWQRRGLSMRKLTVNEEHCWPRFVGQDEKPDIDLRARVLDTLQVLVGADDRSALESFLDERSDAHLAASLQKVSGSVRNISNLAVASRVWATRRWFALMDGYGRSLIWFLPRCFKLLARTIERYMLTATILGIVIGLLYWGFGNTPEGGAYWANFVGVLVTIGTVLALILAVGRQFFAVVVAIRGPVRTWTAKGVAAAAVWVTLVLSLLTLSRTGVWQEWLRSVTDHGSALLSNTPLGYWVVSAFIIAFVAFGSRYAVQRARSPRFKLGDRVEALVVVPIMVSLGACFISVALGAPTWMVQKSALVFSFSVVGFGAVRAVTNTARWIKKYQTLRDAGIYVRQSWFRWWTLWAWFGALLLVCGAGPVLPSATLHLIRHTPLYSFWMLSTGLVTLTLTLSFPIGAVVTWRFVRRVSNRYSEFETSQAAILLPEKLYNHERRSSTEPKSRVHEHVNKPWARLADGQERFW